MDEQLLYKVRTKESGAAWYSISRNLRQIDTFKLFVDARGCRERFNLLKARRSGILKDEERATWISPSTTVKDEVLDEVIERIEEFGDIIQVENDVEKINVRKDKQKAENLRF